MAIYEDGKLKGKLGNVVYRTVNGKSVVQAVPRPPKGGYKLTERNKVFGVATRAASRLYRHLKDFALNLTMRELYASLNSLFLREYEYLQPVDGDGDWSLVPDSLDLRVGKRAWLEDLMDDEVVMRVENGRCRVMMPPVKLQGRRFSRQRIWKETEEMELAFTLLHYDFETGSASVVDRWVSGRFRKSSLHGRVELHYPLADASGNPIENGLLLGCVGLRLYAAEMSDAYLNTAGFNPFSVVGIWAKA